MPHWQSKRWTIVAIVIIGIAVRTAAVIVLQSPKLARSTYEHGEIAANLLAGRGFSTQFLGAFGPTSQQAPIYPLIVAAAFALGGVESEASLWILEFSQALLGGLLVWGVVLLARFASGGRRWVPVVAGLIAALHPTLVYAATHVQVVGLAATLLVWVLVFAERAARSNSMREFAVTGTLLGMLVLTDPILGLAALGIGWIFVSRRGLRGGATGVAIVACVAMVVTAPWIARNYRVHGELVFVKSTFGYAFWQGNCALSQGTDKVVRASVERVLEKPAASLNAQNQALWDARHEAGYIDDIALSAADKRALGRLSEPERSRVLMRRTLEELATEPGRYPILCLKRLQYFLLFDETNPKARHLAYRVPHLFLTIGAIAGFVFASRRQRLALVPGLAVAIAVTAFHSLTIVSARFHIPIEPLLAIWAAIGLDRMVGGGIRAVDRKFAGRIIARLDATKWNLPPRSRATVDTFEAVR